MLSEPFICRVTFYHVPTDNLCSRNRCFILVQVAIDSATPLDEGGASSSYMAEAMEQMRGYGGPMRGYSRLYGNVDFEDVSV